MNLDKETKNALRSLQTCTLKTLGTSKDLTTIKENLRGDQAEAFDSLKIFIDQPVGGMFLLDGYAGTGKTYLMNVVIDYVQEVSKRMILVTAPTHKAVKVIRDHVFDSRVEFATIHSALGLMEHIDGHGKISFRKDEYAPCTLDDFQFLIVDETSMLDDELYDEIYIYASHGLKVLFVGDSLQIPPVNMPDSIPFSRDYRKEDGIGYTQMETIIRQGEGNPIIDYSFKIRQFIYRPTPVPLKEGVGNDQGSITFVPAAIADEFIKDDILPEYKSDQFKVDNDHVKILAWRNKTVDAYNKIIRTHIYGQDALAKILPGERLIATEPWLDEKKVVIHNSEEMEVLSYEIDQWEEGGASFKYYNTHVDVLRSEDSYSEFMVRLIHEDSEKDYKAMLDLQAQYAKSFQQGSFKARDAWIDFFDFKRRFFSVKYSYAITCHKSQGSTYNIAVVMENDIDRNRNNYEKNRILYTACTRPRKDLYVIY